MTVTSARQREALDEAARCMRACSSLLLASAPPELAAVDLREALDQLARITGERVDEAVLDQLFARFCIGK